MKNVTVAPGRVLECVHQEGKYLGEDPYLSVYFNGKVMVREATLKTISVTVRLYMREIFTNMVHMNVLQFRSAFFPMQT